MTVSYTDTKGYLESVNVTSAQTVANVNDLVKGSVTITGAATEGTTLSVNAAITDVDGLGALRYQWLANGKAIAGATSSTLQLAQSHVGAMISVNVSYTDGGGFAESLTSVVTAKVANVNNAPTGAAAVTGLAAEYSTLTLTTSTIADVDGLGKFTLQWQRLVGNNWVDIAKANAATYKLVASDIGSQVRAKVSYVDLQKTAEVVYSTATAPVANVNDRPVGVPTIVGTLVEGSTLTAAAKITDLDGLGAFSYRWEMLSGGSWSTVGSGVSYTLSNDSRGKQVRLVVSYTDGRGTAEAVTSVASKAITTKVLSLTGTANADVLTGMSGADILIGNVGDDRLNGNAGADRLTGGAGADELTGGSGADTFIYTSIAESSSSAGIDTITDFMAGDKISLAAIDANPTAKGDQAFAFKSTASANSVWTAYDGTNTIVSADSTGDTNAELIIKLTGQVNLIAADFIL
ncbi:MAG: hypothetical protein NTZ96_12925 [Burkholderiales bacterium]|nr:hypothetical protein [Burkholderiales bacterium]